MNAATLDYSEGETNGPHIVSVCACVRVDVHLSFDASSVRPFYARRASFCAKLMTLPATVGGSTGNCVTGLGIKCARLNDKSNRCVRACPCACVRACSFPT